MSEVNTAIVLAGGLGTRLSGVVPGLPKPMAPVNGRPFLEHLLDYWIGQGIGHFILSVGYRREAVIDHFGDVYKRCPIAYAVEENPMGTGGGLLIASAGLAKDTPFLLLNGDTYFEVDLRGLSGFHSRNGSGWTFSLFRTSETGRYMGIEVGADGRIRSLKSGTAQPGRLANGGVYLVGPHVLEKCRWKAGDKASLEDDIIPSLLDAGAGFYGYECKGKFIDIGVPGDYFRAAGMPRNV